MQTEDVELATGQESTLGAGNSNAAPGPALLESESPTLEDNKNASHERVPPFSIFTKGEKWTLIAMTSYAGFLSAISSSMYFPAIPTLATDFHTSVSLMNLTITTYLIFQGISPVFWAPLADVKGRRPIYLACLSLLCVTCVAIALVPLDKWWLLLLFRCFQSSGSASTIAMAAGVVSDIALPQERGTFLGVSTLGALLGPSIGPVIGGVFAGTLGWRWIFWFMCIAAGVCFTLILLFLPETLRHIVGDGSIIAPWWDRPLVPLIGPHRRQRHNDDSNSKEPSPQSSTPTRKKAPTRMNPLLLLFQLDAVCCLLCNSFGFSVFTAMQAVMAVVFQRNYPYLNETDIGLCYLPTGLGMMGGSFLTGRFLDRIYKRDRRAWIEANQADDTKGTEKSLGGDGQNDALAQDERAQQELELTFPLERARLKSALAYSSLIGLTALGFGWTVDQKVQLAVPLIFQFVLGWSVIGQGNSFQTLLIDNFPKQGSSTTAMNNLFRCTLAAGLTSVINLILNAIGIGWTLTLIAGVFLVLTPMLTLVVLRIGPKWRRRRMEASWNDSTR
ncbi:hypothetical protein FRB95_007876 [Tulasnella sp. JGI-2019a]|nr:hypothetical protein FRB95_007876 [Tulasnella sp. JGI-2019a]